MIAEALTRFDEVALVLQGGGALGSYQAGVVEGLLDAAIEPTWVAGISIGAINAAIVAGNEPATRLSALQGFWNEVCRSPAPWAPVDVPGVAAWPEPWQVWHGHVAAWSALLWGQSGFFKPRWAPPLWPGAGSAASASWYDTSALKATLERHVDFDRINHPGSMRLSVGAVRVRTGNMQYFDNRRHPLRAEHVMASGALPPGFPAVMIDGEPYWDGGLVSNTPLQQVLDSGRCARNMLVFQVDLWPARGDSPSSLGEVAERLKDIQYSSRTRMITDHMRAKAQHQRELAELLALIPANRRNDALVQRMQARAELQRCNVVHLIYQGKPCDGESKDYEFSALTMRRHWASGLADMRHSLERPGWLAVPTDEQPFVTHDVHRHAPD
ncbi:patatin-like phospholipase family protein [Aquabacterium sp. A3]|uniref:patatin-like phospholipase family protein n=1 Tax=Aquabacterium sp. A3 TaxID=3132829 RepID=UPI003119820C